MSFVFKALNRVQNKEDIKISVASTKLSASITNED
jgi:hypothetical protein